MQGKGRLSAQCWARRGIGSPFGRLHGLVFASALLSLSPKTEAGVTEFLNSLTSRIGKTLLLPSAVLPPERVGSFTSYGQKSSQRNHQICWLPLPGPRPQAIENCTQCGVPQ